MQIEGGCESEWPSLSVLIKLRVFLSGRKQDQQSSQAFPFIMFLQTVSILSALAATVSAHGYVDNATIGGTFYEVRIQSPEPGVC